MKKVNLGYSIKNIPIPTRKNYLLQLLEKNWNGNKKNEVESNTIQQQWK